MKATTYAAASAAIMHRTHAKFASRLEVRLVRAVWRWQRREARRQGVTAALRGGAVVFTQWFGSMLQLTPHLHVLMPEAQWTKPLGATSLGEQLGTKPVGSLPRARPAH